MPYTSKINYSTHQIKMFCQMIESRYTVDNDILKSYLKDLFGEGNFEIIVSLLQQEGI
jgi:hypothetical protein